MEKQAKLFKLLNGVNVNKYVDKKQSLSYLKWMEGFRILHNYVEAVEYRVIDSEGYQYFDSPLGIYVKTEVSVWFEGEKITKSFTLPVLDFSNNPMYSTEGKVIRFKKEIDRPIANMFDINSTIQRCYIKTIAMLGLGSYIYSGFEQPETENMIDAKVIDGKQQEQERKNKIWADFNSLLKKNKIEIEEYLTKNKIDKKNKTELMIFCEKTLKNGVK